MLLKFSLFFSVLWILFYDPLDLIEHSVFKRMLIFSLGLLQEHPTIGQLAEKLLENSIYSIFAVNQMQYKWYEVISNKIYPVFCCPTLSLSTGADIK